jgi:hypothetical protein
MATIAVRGSLGTAYARALVDTGADHSLLPFSVAEDMGADLFQEEDGAASGIGGHEIAIVPGREDLGPLSEGEFFNGKRLLALRNSHRSTMNAAFLATRAAWNSFWQYSTA